MTNILNPLELEELIRKSLDDFYQQRTKALTEIKLSDVLSKKIPYLLRVVELQRVSEIVTEILRAYMSLSDEAFWGELTEVPDFYIKLINLMRDYPVQHRIEFEKEWAKAINRFEHDFFNNFGNPDESIDWEKLLRYNTRD